MIGLILIGSMTEPAVDIAVTGGQSPPLTSSPSTAKQTVAVSPSPTTRLSPLDSSDEVKPTSEPHLSPIDSPLPTPEPSSSPTAASLPESTGSGGNSLPLVDRRVANAITVTK